MLKTNYRCVHSLNISVDVAKCVENVHTLIHNTHFWTVTKKDLSSLNNLFMAKFQLISMPSYSKRNYRCVQSLNISVDVTKCVENDHTLIHYTHFWTVTKKDCSSLNNLFMAKIQLISMSSYPKNKLQICSVIQHQCRRPQMFGKCSQIQPVHFLFVRYKKRLVLIEQSIHGKISTH